MSQGNHDRDAAFDRIDADAVCEACGTVNPEDTLFCKSCGNNLRDQRVQRIAEGRGLEQMVEATATPAQWLSKGLTVLGILVVIWTALNVSTVEQWLLSTQKQLSSEASPESLWSGPDRAAYDDLLKEINDRPLTEEEINSVGAASQAQPGYAGRYLIKRSARPSEAVIGQAALKQTGDRVLFVAKLSADIELRGEINTSSANPATVFAAMKSGRRYAQIFGIAQRAADGSYACYGQQEVQSEDSDSPTITAVAYRIP